MFILSETIKIILRSKLHFVLNLISMSLAVILIILSLLLIFASDLIDKFIEENISVSVFIKEDFAEDKINEIEKSLMSKNYVYKVEYISKKKAYEIFIEETGEDFHKILEVNPLPRSFNIFLKKDYLNSKKLKSIENELLNIPGISEVYSKIDLFERVLFLAQRIKNYIIISTLIIIIISIYLVLSTNKLIISSNNEKYETMKLVGAKLSTIKLPIVLNNFLVGFLAGLISLGLIYFITKIFNLNIILISNYLNVNIDMAIVFILVIGPILGVIVSLISLRKVTLKVKSF